MKYIIDIDNDEHDEFEVNADNVVVVEVFDNNGHKVTFESKVQIYLSKNALLGLGTELIRLAHKYIEGKHYHITPADKDMLCQRLGIFLTPDSSELIITCSDNKKIDEYI
jgi:hypothetical protein